MKFANMQSGPHIGKYTLFMTSDEATEFFDYPSLKKRALPPGSADTIEQVTHIYIEHVPGTVAIEPLTSRSLIKWNSLGLPVTYQTSIMSFQYRDRFGPNVHIVLAVKYSPAAHGYGFTSLLDTDEVLFFGDNEQPLRVVSVGDMRELQTAPEEIIFTASRS